MPIKDKKKRAEYWKKYRKKNRDALKIRKAEYYQNNKEKIKQYKQDKKKHIAKTRKKYNEKNKQKNKEYDKGYKQKNKQKIKERMVGYRQDKKKHLKGYNKNYKDNHKKELLAQSKIAYLIKRSITPFIREDCAFCNKKSHVCHHENYDEPYFIYFLCGSCHMDLHRNEIVNVPKE